MPPRSREPLVLLPGMNCSAHLWRGVEELVTRTCPQLELLHPRLAADSIDGCVSTLLDGLPPRFALAGLSLGAVVAMAVVRRAPQRVTRLCLLSANPHPPTAAQLQAWEHARSDLARGRTARDIQQDLLPVMLHPDARTPELDERVLRMAEEVGTQVLDHQLAAQATRIDERPGLARVRLPTLVVAAAGDALCSVAKHEEMHALVPGSRLAVLDGVGHLSPVEAPESIADQLLGWLD